LSTSLIYRSAGGYELLMRALYGRHYAARMRSVAGEVPSGASVVELCCGPGTLYLRYLKGRVGRYVGLDVNERFVGRLRRRGVDARVVDLAAGSGETLPGADVVILQASLYHFLPAADPLVDRMLAAARDRVIVSEPIRNLASSGWPLVGALAAVQDETQRQWAAPTYSESICSKRWTFRPSRPSQSAENRRLRLFQPRRSGDCRRRESCLARARR
jgi:SAM-dependent methyltransferase